MKLDLAVETRIMRRAQGPITEVVFSVIDLDKAENYPRNFVCILPKDLKGKSKSSRNFVKIFGEDSTKIAVQLLKKSAKNEDSSEIQYEIGMRLKALRPKQMTKCIICEGKFEPRRFGKYIQSVCQTCRDKGASNKYKLLSKNI
jgi:hypothetical protein